MRAWLGGRVVFFALRRRSGPRRRAAGVKLRSNLGGQNLNVTFTALMLPLAVAVAWRCSLLLGTAASSGSEHGESNIGGVVGALEVDGSSLLLLEAHIVCAPPGFLFTRLA